MSRKQLERVCANCLCKLSYFLYRANGQGGKSRLGTVMASHTRLTLQALSSSLNAGTAKGSCLARGEAFGCQSVHQNGRVHLHIIDIKKRLLQKSEGNLAERSPGWILRGIFWWIFSGLLSLEKIGRKHPPTNPRQNSNRNLGASRPKSTLQGSGLEEIFVGEL